MINLNLLKDFVPILTHVELGHVLKNSSHPSLRNKLKKSTLMTDRNLMKLIATTLVSWKVNLQRLPVIISWRVRMASRRSKSAHLGKSNYGEVVLGVLGQTLRARLLTILENSEEMPETSINRFDR